MYGFLIKHSYYIAFPQGNKHFFKNNSRLVKTASDERIKAPSAAAGKGQNGTGHRGVKAEA